LKIVKIGKKGNFAVFTYFASREFLFDKMNFFERVVIKRIVKTTKSVPAIKTDGIDKLITEIINSWI
jgi:hypothetical protein